MKTTIQILTILLFVTAVAAGGYWLLRRDYVNNFDLNAKLAFLQEQYDRKLLLLDGEINQLQNSFQEHKKANVAEIKAANETIAALQEDNKKLHEEIDKLQAMGAKLQELQDTYVSKNDLQSTFKAAVEYFPTSINLGILPAGKGKDLTYKIPSDVPDTAREILIYVYIATNYVKGGPHNFKLSVTGTNSKEAAFYLHAVANAQQGWSYNSENIWLPMPANRELKLQSDGEPLFGSWDSGVRIIAYR